MIGEQRVRELSVGAMFQLLCAVRQMLDYRTPDVGGIPGLTFNTDSNANAGNRIE